MEMIWVIGASVLLLAGFGANEMTHGGVAGTMGLGHHHMLDYGGYHCADHHDDAVAGDHFEHMHSQAWNGSWNGTYGPGYHEHAACYSDGQAMHDQHMGAEPWDHMGPGGGHMAGGGR